MAKPGWKKKIKRPAHDPKDPNNPEHWTGLGKILDDGGIAFEAFEEVTRPQLNEYEALTWTAVPTVTAVIRAEIGTWASKLAYIYSQKARAEIYAARARAVVKYTLKKTFPKHSGVDQVDACAARVVGYLGRWKALQDSMEERVRVGKKLLGDEDREKKGFQA